MDPPNNNKMEEAPSQPPPASASGNSSNRNLPAATSQPRPPTVADHLLSSTRTASSTRSVHSKISLKDVLREHPSEPEEETRIMEDLDTMDPTKARKKSVAFETMPGLEEQISLLVQPLDKPEHINGVLSEIPNDHSQDQQQPMTVEEQLCAATNALNDLHRQTAAAAKAANLAAASDPETGGLDGATMLQLPDPADLPPPPGEIYRGSANSHYTPDDFDEEIEDTQFNQFAANAGKIFHKFQKKENRKNRRRRTYKNSGRKHSDGTSIRTNQTTSTVGTLGGMMTPSFEILREFREIIGSNRSGMWRYIRLRLMYIIIPATGLACLLYYVFENPTGIIDIDDPTDDDISGNSTNTTNDDDHWIDILPELRNSTEIILAAASPTPTPTVEDGEEEQASVSWLILFIAVRQVITWMMATGLQFFIVACATKLSYGYVGPITRLVILQAQGMPLQFMLWSVIDFAILQGSGQFVKHWLFFQEIADVFNANNPAGDITERRRYFLILLGCVLTGFAVAMKRLYIGLRFETKSYNRYSGELSKTLKQIVLVGEISKSSMTEHTEADGILVSLLDEWFLRSAPKMVHNLSTSTGDRSGGHSRSLSTKSSGITSEVSNDDDNDVDDGGLGVTSSENHRANIEQMLGEWEDLDILDNAVEKPSISSIVQFRSSVSVLKSEYPFSPFFGKAKTREDVVEGSQRLYLNLLQKQERLNLSKSMSAKSNDDEDDNYVPALLHFHTIALAALNPRDQSVDDQMIKDMVRLLRPSRTGEINLLEFCKSIDTLYKKMRKLRASLVNEGRVNAASERLLNAIFYFILFICWLAIIGIDPIVLIGLFSSMLISISFMIGGAAADYFRGLLLVLVQRPYDIGDRISVANPESESNPSGASGWIIKDVTLYHTTVIYVTTQEYATISNGALSKSRIINCARSPRATVFFLAKFGIGVSIDTISKYRERLTDYVKSKPREWIAFSAFRMTRFEADLGYVEYKIILQHREAWQQMPAILTSLGDVQAYGFMLVQEMNMGYKSPSLPVEMRLTPQPLPPERSPYPNDHASIRQMFGDGVAPHHEE